MDIIIFALILMLFVVEIAFCLYLSIVLAVVVAVFNIFLFLRIVFAYKRNEVHFDGL